MNENLQIGWFQSWTRTHIYMQDSEYILHGYGLDTERKQEGLFEEGYLK